MAIPSKQIGWGTQENLLWEISKQLEQLAGVMSKIGQTTSTTTTTVAPSTTTTTTTQGVPILKWRYTSIDSPQDVCINPGLLPFSFNGSTLCDSTSIYLDTSSIDPLGDSIIFYGAYQGIARVWNVVGPNQADIFSPIPDCFTVPC
jgi:hypothetical protein